MNKHHKDNNITVEMAALEDIPGIIAVLEENLLINKDRSVIGDLEQGGFLIARHSVEDLHDWIEDKENHIVMVYKEAQKIIGYILGCNLSVLSSEMQTKIAEIQLLRDISATNLVLYHKQIAIKPNQKGVGSKLLQSFFDFAVMKGCHHIVCFIVHEPILNKVSIGFHQKHGFECVGLVQIEDLKDGVYLKKLRTN
ncbi:MAG TPA: GNAT family N-acetyltransferase [Gammaproteobacteria bacterium]|jgi:hypothetical protein|nr:GNAT family N-acetyltransferase [Gammaproteobacteria bacterium]